MVAAARQVMGMDEAAFFARVRRAVQQEVPDWGGLMHDQIRQRQQHSVEATAGLAAEPGGVLGELPDVPPRSDQAALAERWLREFARLGGRGELVDGSDEAAEAVVARVRAEQSVRRGPVALSRHPLLTELRLAERLRADGLHVIVESGRSRDEVAKATVGITVAAAALAETGTIVLSSDSTQGRAGSLLPPVHLTIVPAGVLWPSLAAWLITAHEWASGWRLPASLALASGPSRSADIAGDMALGVHGPGVVYAVLMGAERYGAS